MIAPMDQMSTLGVYLGEISYAYEYVTRHIYMIASIAVMSALGVCIRRPWNFDHCGADSSLRDIWGGYD